MQAGHAADKIQSPHVENLECYQCKALDAMIWRKSLDGHVLCPECYPKTVEKSDIKGLSS